MKLLKPSWVHHDDKPIFSVDVHQECEKFATGGQGLDSGRVVIWNLLPVVSEKAEINDSVPKILCQMDNHLACVNCVRWSQNGQMLASGSDDKLVMVWRQSKSSSGVFGTGGIQKNAESWKCAATLRGHSGDVLDLAWSPQDRWLASCSVDNTIIVWDAQAWPSIVAMLKGHTGLVKGVAWDPVGKFLATQSDDRSVKVWKTSDWSCSSTITEPFEECGGTTHILRLSWSPDGQYLVSAHAMNGGGPTAQIIEREGWKCDKDFVGHRKAVTCVRFHNAILKRQTPKTNKAQQYCCLAVGSRDRSLSVWMTALQRPLVVIHELFKDSILDLSWGPSKCILMACSGDGTVACLQFSAAELGTPLSEEDKNSLYQRVYGKSALVQNGASGVTDLLIENPALLNCSQQKLQAPTLPTNTFEVQSTHEINFSTTSLSAPANGFETNVNANYAQSPSKAISKQMETRTADGKRRITPVFIPLNQELSTPTPQLSSSSRPMTTSTNTCDAAAEICVKTKEDCQLILDPKPLLTVPENIRLDTRLTKCSDSMAALVQPPQTNKNAIKAFPTQINNKFPHCAVSSSRKPQATAATPTQASTTGPKLSISITSKCEFQKTALDYRVHVHNGSVQTASGPLAKITAYVLSRAMQLWQIFVGSPIVNFNFCTKYVMMCSLDGTMRLLKMDTGCAVLPVITMTTAAVQCAFCPFGKLVGVITECGLLRIWNIEDANVVLATTCGEVLNKFGAVIQFTITEHGVPFVHFANGNAYSYSAKLQSWLVLNTKDPVLRHGLQATMPKEFRQNYHLYPLISAQAATYAFVANCNTIDINLFDWQSSAKITFIENQIQLCQSIDSPEELKHWYSMLAYHLAISGTEKRLRVLLDDLLSPLHRRTLKEAKILTIPKHVLLENVLQILKPHVKWQRIYMEYSELYEDWKSKNESEMSNVESSAMETT